MEPTRANVKKVIEQSLDAILTDSDVNLFDQGILDSFQSVNLVVTLEKSFNVELSVLDFAENENFTLNNITNTIAKKKKTSL